MAQTLEELFKSKQLVSQGGKTAEEAYAVRNSKDIRISTSDPLVNNTGFGPARLLRKTLGVKGSESFLEQEATGIRVIRGFSTPVIYGNEIGRITLRTTPTLDLMKTATSGELGDDGGGLIGQGLGKLTGGKVKSLSQLRDNVNTKLGIPQAATPTFVVNALSAGGSIQYKIGGEQKNEVINLGLVQDRMNDLAAIKGSAAGSLIGALLKEGGGGNLKTIGKQALGSAIKLGKKALRKKLFGGGDRKQEEKATPVKSTTLYPSDSNRPIDFGFIEDILPWATAVNINYGDNENANPKNDPKEGKVDKDGASYSKTISTDDSKTPQEQNQLSYKQQLDYEPLNEWRNQGGDIAPIRFSQTPDRISKFSDVGTLIKYNINNNLENSKRGFYTTKDSVNQLGVISGNADSYPENNDKLDFVPLKFYSIVTEKTAQFRCTISGLSESFSPSWESYKFLGNPFNNYTYSGIERSVTFNFKAYSLNAKEHKVVWDKLNFLAGLVYPQGYYESSALQPPFIKFTLGDLYKNKNAFIESLSYNYEDGTPWNITDTEKTVNYDDGGTVTGLSNDIDMKGYRLPMIVDVACTIKFLESRGNTSGRKFFNFNPQTS